MANEIALNTTLNVESVLAGEQPRLVYLLIDVRPGEGVRPDAAPVNMAVVLDVSESMRLPVLTQRQFKELSEMGQANQTVSDGVPVWTFKTIPEHIRRQAPSNLEAVQSAISEAAVHFEQGDRVSLVAFADRAEVLLRGLNGAENDRLLSAVSDLGKLNLGDQTEIGAGLESGLSEVGRAATPNMVNRVLVLTDGFTRDAARVTKLAKQARAANVAVSTLGIGADFNERLLVDMADASHGNAYFARTPREIPPAFAQELAAVQSVTVRGVEIEVRLSAGVEMRRAYRVRPAISAVVDAKREGRTVAVSMGDLDPANPPALLVEVIVPTQQRGTFRVAGISVNYTAPNGGTQVGATRDIVIRYSMAKEREEPNTSVMNTVEKVTAYVLQTRALNDMAAGNISAATMRLRAAATRLLTIGETDLANSVEAEAARLEKSGQVSAEGAKEIRYATRKLTQRLDT